MISELRRTPLYHSHVERGGKIVPFAGWEMPVQFSGIIEEHKAVREHMGIFDVSHMGELRVTGPGSANFLNYLTCNDIGRLNPGKAQYSAILNVDGGVIDDIIVYMLEESDYLLCVNAANVCTVLAWLEEQKVNGVIGSDAITLVNESEKWGQIAVQGPEAIPMIGRILPEVPTLPPFGCIKVDSSRISPDLTGQMIVARTGYTGEDGCEVFAPSGITQRLWNLLIDELGAKPCGLGARDTLRLEAAYPLHGHELSPEISAMESGLGWIVKFKKGDFIGAQALLEGQKSDSRRALIGLVIEGAGIARHGDKVVIAGGKEVGVVTSGTKTPTVNQAIGLALVDHPFAKIGEKFEIIVRERRLAAKVVPTPFYSRLSRSKM